MTCEAEGLGRLMFGGRPSIYDALVNSFTHPHCLLAIPSVLQSMSPGAGGGGSLGYRGHPGQDGRKGLGIVDGL